MNSLIPTVSVSPLRQRLIDEMEIRRFGRETQRNYIRDVGQLATFLGRSPATARQRTCGASRSSTASLAYRCRP